jgi:uncharacterized protein YodC (DUF2158 family)
MNIGDPVMLKSGGPAMTVVGTTNAGRIRCAWWSTQLSKFEEAEFPPGALKSGETPAAATR